MIVGTSVMCADLRSNAGKNIQQRRSKKMRDNFMNKPKYDTPLKRLDRVKMLEQKTVDQKKEIETLHGIIQQLTRELDEAEEHAYVMQEKISTLMEKVKL